jgi:hypothetical protein
MTKTNVAWTAAAALHLALVACGALGIVFGRNLDAAMAIGHYAAASGADSSYGFFAPAVASQCRAFMTMRDAAGREWRDSLAHDPRSVFGLRATSILDSIPSLSDRLRRGVTASWASAMFGRHPSAVTVLVSVELHVLPTMAEWRDGVRPSWMTIYEARFVRAGG